MHKAVFVESNVPVIAEAYRMLSSMSVDWDLVLGPGMWGEVAAVLSLEICPLKRAYGHKVAKPSWSRGPSRWDSTGNFSHLRK